MDQSAITEIESLTLSAHAKQIPLQYADRVAALHNNFKLIDLEKFHASRYRFRGALTTNSLSDFVAYVNRNKGGEGFIDAERLSAKVFFNLGDTDNPGHADWHATLGLERTAPFTALLAVDGKAFTQQSLIEFLEDWQPYMEAVGEDESIGSVKGAIAAIRVIKIKAKSETESREENFRGARSSLEEVEASSTLGLPAGFKFTVTPYLGLAERNFFVRLSISTDPDKPPRLGLRIIQKEDHVEAIAQDFKEVLLREIVDTTLTLGTFTP